MHISSQKLMYEVTVSVSCDFLFSFSLVCYVAVCACIRSAVTKLKVSQKRICSNLKEKPGPDQAKTPHEYTPPHVYVTISGVTGHKIHGSVLYDTVVSQFGTFPIWGVGQLVTSQCWKCFKP